MQLSIQWLYHLKFVPSIPPGFGTNLMSSHEPSLKGQLLKPQGKHLAKFISPYQPQSVPYIRTFKLGTFKDTNVRTSPCTPAVVLLYFSRCVCLVTQSCLTLCNPKDRSLPGSSVQGFPRQEYWSELPFPSPGIFTTQIKPSSPAQQVGFFLPLSHLRSLQRNITQPQTGTNLS